MITNIVLASTPLYEHITRYVLLIAPFARILAHAAQAMGVLLFRASPKTKLLLSALTFQFSVLSRLSYRADCRVSS